MIRHSATKVRRKIVIENDVVENDRSTCKCPCEYARNESRQTMDVVSAVY